MKSGRTGITNYCFGSDIVEWDISSANTSLMEFYHLKPQKVIERLRQLPKEQRVVKVGLMLQKDKDFSKALQKAFDDITTLFVEANGLTSEDIIAVKKDAVYVKNHVITVQDFGGCVHFVPKNTYHAYYYIDPLEIYVGTKVIDVKGIGDENLPLHKSGILQMIGDVTRLCEVGDLYGLNEYMHSVADAYKKRELPIDWYREFNANSCFKWVDGDGYVLLSDIREDDLSEVDITHNYMKVILPLIQMIC